MARLISWGESSSFQVHTVYSTSWWLKLPGSVFIRITCIFILQNYKCEHVCTLLRARAPPLHFPAICQVWSPDPTLSGRGCGVPAAGGERRCAGLPGERGSAAGWRFGWCGVAPPSREPLGRRWAAPLEPKLWAERRRLQPLDRRGFLFGSGALDQTHWTQARRVCECVRPQNVFLAVQIRFSRHTGWRF